MTRDDIIHMARDVGFFFHKEDLFFQCTTEELERFAALVAAAEREACIAACAPYEGDHYVNKCIEAIRNRSKS